ncbi:hypothetical protein EAH87_17765 [Sphingomonas koreensis]|nr:hypothetical protein EAH87_17765 [Sphingomonas koreensis]
MSTDVRNRIPGLDRIFLFSMVMSSAAAYSVLYLFHIVVFFRTVELFGGKKYIILPRILQWDIVFFAFLLIWYTASIAWAENKLYAIEYCGYIFLASLAVFYMVQICLDRAKLILAYRLLAILILIEIFLSLLEGMGILRLPFSPYSPYLHYFGRVPSDLTDFSYSAMDYIGELPTGFFPNPNNLAAFLALVMPFFLLHRTILVKILGTSAVIYVVYMCGARATLIACGIMIVVSAFVWGGRAMRVGALIAILIVGVSGAGVVDSLSESSIPRLAEVGNIGVAVEGMWDSLREGRELSQDSSGARAQLILNGLDALRETKGLGVGGGGSKTVQEESVFQAGNLTSMHNFWVELLVEGGVVVALVFGTWYVFFLWRLWKVARSSPDTTLRYFGRALFTGFFGFLVAAIGPSSVIYMLPMWMMVGIGLSVIRIANVQRLPARTRQQRPRSTMIQRASRPARTAGHQGI